MCMKECFICLLYGARRLSVGHCKVSLPGLSINVLFVEHGDIVQASETWFPLSDAKHNDDGVSGEA